MQSTIKEHDGTEQQMKTLAEAETQGQRQRQRQRERHRDGDKDRDMVTNDKKTWTH